MDVRHINLIGGLVTHNPPKNVEKIPRVFMGLNHNFNLNIKSRFLACVKKDINMFRGKI